MATRSPTLYHSTWGAYPTASLPTSSAVQVGDTAYDTTLGALVVCTATGPVTWGSVGGGGGSSALLSVSMTNAVTAAAQLGAPTFVRRPGGFSTWDGLGIPTLTAGVSVPSYPSQTGLQFTLSATIAGGWVYPLSGLTSIPASGVALEVDIGAQDSGIDVMVMPIARFSGGNVTGFSMRHFDNQAQIDSNLVDLAGPSPNTGTVQSIAWNMNYAFPTTPLLSRSLNKIRYEVVADGPQTPARWRVSGFASNTAALNISPPNAAGVSGAADAVPAWDGQARPTLGLGIYRFGSGTGSMVLTRIQVFAL
jgi:hypothetical protein